MTENENAHPILRHEGRDSWENARLYFDLVGEPSGLFSALIRQAAACHGKTSSMIYGFPLGYLYNSRSIKAVLHHAALAMHPTETAAIKELSAPALLDVFEPNELAAIMAISFLCTRFQKKVKPEFFEDMYNELKIQVHTGFLVGSMIPAIGIPAGMMVGAVRPLCVSLFSIHDQRGFKGLRRQLRQTNNLFDMNYEQFKWGCNHCQVASMFLQNLGLGISAAKGITVGAQDLGAAEDEGRDRDAATNLRWYGARRWIEALLQEETAPQDFREHEEFMMTEADMAKLQERIEMISQNGSNFDWIKKRKEDITDEVASQLQKGFDASKAAKE